MTESTVTPRGLTGKGRAQRARIATVAAELMHVHGVQGTSNEMVRRAAGISGSQLSHYFPDKESLVRGVLELRADTIVGVGDPAGPPRLDSVAALRRWASSYVDDRPELCRRGCLFGSLSSQVVKSDLGVQDAVAEGFARIVALFASALRAMADRGELVPHADPDQLAVSLVAAFQGGMLLSQAAPDPAPLRAALDAALDHVESLTT